MPRALSPFLVTALLAATAGTLSAQTAELAPSLPSDTLQAKQPADSDDFFPDATPVTPGDSAALRELKAWIEHHPGIVLPPPKRAVLVKV